MKNITMSISEQIMIKSALATMIHLYEEMQTVYAYSVKQDYYTRQLAGYQAIYDKIEASINEW